MPEKLMDQFSSQAEQKLTTSVPVVDSVSSATPLLTQSRSLSSENSVINETNQQNLKVNKERNKSGQVPEALINRNNSSSFTLIARQELDNYSLISEEVQSSKNKTGKEPVVDNEALKIPENSSSIMEGIHPVIKSFLVGSISGTCSTVLFQPLDLLKTRLQSTRHDGLKSSLRGSGVAAAAAATTAPGPNGLFTVIAHVVRDEKVLGLWRGMTPSLTRCVPGVGLYFASIHGLKIAFDIKGEYTPLQSVFLGVTGRTISGVLMIPFTVIKTRFESTVYNYASIREALYSIYSREGVRGLTCGLLPTLLRDAPFSGLYLLMYTSTKRVVPQDWIESQTFGPSVRFSCGVVAGIGASLITQPADVLKTKMQLYPDKFNSIPQVAAFVYKKYGAQGYFKGLVPRMIRRTLIAAMSWTVYEQVMKSFGLK